MRPARPGQPQQARYVKALLSVLVVTVLAGCIPGCPCQEICLPFLEPCLDCLLSHRGIPWLYDLEAGRQTAAQQDRLLFVEFYSPTCGVCTRMDRDVFSQESVVEALADFVPVKLDVGTHQDLAASYGVLAVPTLIVMDSQGTLIARYVGYLEPDELIAFLEGVLQTQSTRASRTPSPNVRLERVRTRPAPVRTYADTPGGLAKPQPAKDPKRS